MADENVESKPAAPEKKRNKLPFIVIAALMGIEGVAVFFVAKVFILPEPAAAVAAEDSAQKLGREKLAEEAVPTAEVPLTDCRPSNRVTGKLVTFRLRVTALVALEDKERTAALVEANEARITDRINFVIRSAEPQHLNEPGLETVKRRFKHEMDRILGNERLIREILIPQMLQSGPGV